MTLNVDLFTLSAAVHQITTNTRPQKGTTTASGATTTKGKLDLPIRKIRRRSSDNSNARKFLEAANKSWNFSIEDLPDENLALQRKLKRISSRQLSSKDSDNIHNNSSTFGDGELECPDINSSSKTQLPDQEQPTEKNLNNDALKKEGRLARRSSLLVIAGSLAEANRITDDANKAVSDPTSISATFADDESPKTKNLPKKTTTTRREDKAKRAVEGANSDPSSASDATTESPRSTTTHNRRSLADSPPASVNRRRMARRATISSSMAPPTITDDNGGSPKPPLKGKKKTRRMSSVPSTTDNNNNNSPKRTTSSTGKKQVVNKGPVRFELDHKNRIKRRVSKFRSQASLRGETQALWWSEEELERIYERENDVYEHYASDTAYTKSLRRLWNSCSKAAATGPQCLDADITTLVADSPSRGLEVDILETVRERRLRVIGSVLDAQEELRDFDPILRTKVLAARFKNLSRSAVRFARKMAEGDAEVAAHLHNKQQGN